MQYKIFWCKVNKYYTDKWLNSEYLKHKNGIFIASCVVTDKAKRKWIKFVKDVVKDLNNSEKIFISWCWAFKNWKAQSNFFEIYPEIEYLKWKIEILWEKPQELKKEIINSKENKNKINFKEKLKKIPQIYTKKFLLIQGWCDSFCTFCLTVKKRWRHYFRDKQDIVDEILEFENNWWKEVVLTWVNLSAWWVKNTNDTWNSRFAELLQYILDNTIIPRIRISSMWPEFINNKCLEIFKKTRIYPHFHYSVQSGSTNILKKMHRHYNWEYIRNLLQKTKNLVREDGVQISIWADLIIWFPSETEKDFKKNIFFSKRMINNKNSFFSFFRTYNVRKCSSLKIRKSNWSENKKTKNGKNK